MNLKCFFKGHDWHYVSRSRLGYSYWGKPVPIDRWTNSIHTIFLYSCDRCGKFKEKELKGDYGDIPADELIRVKD